MSGRTAVKLNLFPGVKAVVSPQPR